MIKNPHMKIKDMIKNPYLRISSEEGLCLQQHKRPWHIYLRSPLQSYLYGTLTQTFMILNTEDHIYIVLFQKISIPIPRMVIGNSKVEGFSIAKIYKRKYEAKLEIPGGGGGRTKEPPLKEVWIFLGTTNLMFWSFFFNASLISTCY